MPPDAGSADTPSAIRCCNLLSFRWLTGSAGYRRAMPKLYRLAGAIIAPVAGAVIVTIENDPDDVVSRLSKWYSLTARPVGHVSEPPSWPTVPSADKIGLLVAVSVAFVGILMIFWPYLPKPFKSCQASLPLSSRMSGSMSATSRASTSAESGSSADVTRVGSDSVVMDRVDPGAIIGPRSVVVGPTDERGNTIFDRGGMAVGYNARADSTGIAVGAKANAHNSRPEIKQSEDVEDGRKQ